MKIIIASALFLINLVLIQAAYLNHTEAVPFFKVEKQNERIVGGYPANPKFVPWQVAVHMTTSQGAWFFCGGSLISRTWVLTAAHCVYSYTSWKLRFGATRIDTTEWHQQVQTAYRAIYHIDYDQESLRNDIGVIPIPNAVELNEFVQIISLPRRSDVGYDLTGQEVLVSGWGKTSDQSSISNQLMYTYSRVISNNECLKTYWIVFDTTLCIKGPNRQSTCNGDSGGPLVYNNVLHGAVSFGPLDGCMTGKPTGFSRITKFLDWISYNTGIQIQQ